MWHWYIYTYSYVTDLCTIASTKAPELKYYIDRDIHVYQIIKIHSQKSIQTEAIVKIVQL